MESAVDQRQIVSRLVEKAKKYRNFARWIGDRETVQSILDLTEELKQRARALARLTKIESEGAPGKSGKKMAGQPEGTKSFGYRPSGNFGKLKKSPKSAATMFRRRTLDYSPSRWFTRRRFEPSSSPSAINLERQPLSSVDHPQNPQQTETF
jgi:hypothetical protein